MKTKNRKAAPDIIKIAATIFVIIIHHKKFNTAHYAFWYNVFIAIVITLSVACAIYMLFRTLRSGRDKKSVIHSFVLPLLATVGIIWLRWFAVCIFLIMSGYLLSGSIDKLKRPFFEWYTLNNISTRILRFYIPLVPVYFLGLIYKIFVLGREYSLAEFVLRFLLGGFKPGSYYIVILAQLVLVFPLIHYIVKRFRFSGVMMCVLFTFFYDIIAKLLNMSPVLYKFLIFRLTTHVAFGVYARYADFKKEKAKNIILFAVGFTYAVCCMYSDIYRPPIFFEWQEASFPTAFYLYPIIMLLLTEFEDIRYTDSGLSKYTITFANATYHIFLIQLLYYTTFGFDFNAYVNNVALTMFVNIIITVPLGILYYKIMSPTENKILARYKK